MDVALWAIGALIVWLLVVYVLARVLGMNRDQVPAPSRTDDELRSYTTRPHVKAITEPRK